MLYSVVQILLFVLCGTNLIIFNGTNPIVPLPQMVSMIEKRFERTSAVFRAKLPNHDPFPIVIYNTRRHPSSQTGYR